ncbi:hypothetical protein N782_10725 [Pontibacillus yanchengensis Y32]|uniref:Uncharacterized protein n=1 Tax=Pontibacillus yanchengensis Y32 TaxID=1385514 RepID=A0A0A2TF66_9BACI|nr:hypothetical protein N782_10725 [Pontibacillus yanchengensis Y32]
MGREIARFPAASHDVRSVAFATGCSELTRPSLITYRVSSGQNTALWGLDTSVFPRSLAIARPIFAFMWINGNIARLEWDVLDNGFREARNGT